ncbi:hypothetical protein EDD18DRAFT_1108465 [Armillaria luteobubalina]|uniref:Uncharacterized protein n=1 Tax=Armillaria luteobubalina TaxID=153913 RepID=A0AA39ULF2_9AGAR|nr:hypothetical protein EDD18DRAFT_1108465 [Armillaria luteobubalina]
MSSHAGDSASELNDSPQRSVPLEHLGPRWYLHKDVSQEWQELELALLRLRQFACSAVSDLDSGRLLYPWLEPMRYGYAGGKCNDRTLGKKIMDSRAMFMLIMAEVAYNAACHHNFWDEVVLPHFGPHMTDLLKETWMAHNREGHGGYQPKDGFECGLERVGLFMDADRCKFASAIAPMIQGHIPLWIKWGMSSGMTHRGLDQYRPSDKEIQEAEQAQVMPTAPQPRPRIAGKSSHHEAPLMPGPSQIQEGGTWGGTKNTQMVEKESDKSHQACLQRKKHAFKQMPPGSKGAAIFRWEHDHEKGYLLCKHVPHRQVEDTWMEFHDTQRCYDGFHNEWDLNRCGGIVLYCYLCGLCNYEVDFYVLFCESFCLRSVMF